MKKIFFLLLLLLSVSCGSIIKDKKSLDSEKESVTDSNASSATNRWINSSNYILEPVNLDKPILWNRNGKVDTIYNTRVVYNNTNTKEIIRDTTSTKKKETEKIQVDQKQKKTDNTLLILGIIGIGLFLFLIVILVGFFYLKNKV